METTTTSSPPCLAMWTRPRFPLRTPPSKATPQLLEASPFFQRTATPMRQELPWNRQQRVDRTLLNLPRHHPRRSQRLACLLEAMKRWK